MAKIVITLEDLRKPVKPTVRILAPEIVRAAPESREPVAAPHGAESTLSVDPAALRKLTKAEQRAELAWINAVCAEACALVGLDWATLNIKVSMNTRFTRRLGDARCTRCSWSDPQGRLRFSASALWRRTPKDQRRNTVVHELAHVLAFARHGRTIKPHGREWRAMHRELGEEPSRCHYVNRDGLRRRQRRPRARARRRPVAFGFPWAIIQGS